MTEEDIFPMIDALDHEILMHREAHFGGQFPIMLDYYRNEGKGVNPEFCIERIERLAEMETQMNQNLAPLLLAGPEAEKVAESRDAYKKLRDIYEIKNPKSLYPQLIADLILSEDEESEEEVKAIVAEKGAIVSPLIDLLQKEEIYDPLFPGYGLVSGLVVKCLGFIGDKRAIISLFQSIGESDFFVDDAIIKALKQIGEPAKKFLQTVMKGKPLTEDNERAAIALIAFKDDPEVTNDCFNLLNDQEILKDPCLPTYLVLVCEGIQDPQKRYEFVQWSEKANLPKHLLKDVHAVVHSWSSS